MNSKQANSLMKAVATSGLLTKDAQQALGGVPDLGDKIQDALGVSPDSVEATEVFLLTKVIDDSSSIRSSSNEDNVREGHNIIIDALRASKAENDILVHSLALNRGVIYPYSALVNVPRLDANNYSAQGSTPLYDKTIEALAIVVAKEQEFATQGVPVRTVTIIVSDGADYGSTSTPRDVKAVVESLLARENHIIAAMGIDDGHTDFVSVFQSMGIPKDCILTPKNDPKEIRKAFQVFSKSSVQASSGAAGFSKMGGFAA